MMNLGPRPTFGESETILEAHLFGASGDFYGAAVRIDFIAFLRDTRKFASAEELVRQLERDRENALVVCRTSRYASPGTYQPS
jgi:riboflavin kinase/FMN adenylyltransferase